jgi:hypothetical protein
MKVIKYRVKMIGRRPLMLANVQAASRFNHYAKRIAPLQAKTRKTEEDQDEILRLQWESSFYMHDDHGPVVPTANIFKSFVEAGKRTRAGKKVEGGVIALDAEVPLQYDGPRTLHGLWTAGDGGFDSPYVDVRLVTTSAGKKVDAARPIFREWSCESEWLLDPAMIDVDEFEDIVRRAGTAIGVGAYRLKYGRYSAILTAL